MSNLLLIEDNKLLSLMERRHLTAAFPEVHLSVALTRNQAVREAAAIPPDRAQSYKNKIFEIVENPFETEPLVFVVERALHTRASAALGVVEGPISGGDQVTFDRHKVLNVLAGILAGVRAFEADLDAEAEHPEIVRELVAKYIPYLVERPSEWSYTKPVFLNAAAGVEDGALYRGSNLARLNAADKMETPGASC